MYLLWSLIQLRKIVSLPSKPLRNIFFFVPWPYPEPCDICDSSVFPQFKSQEFFFPRKLKWRVSPNKLAHTLTVHFESYVSLSSGAGWSVLCLIFELLVSFSPPTVCVVTPALNLQPGSCGHSLTHWRLLRGPERGTWSPGFES